MNAIAARLAAVAVLVLSIPAAAEDAFDGARASFPALEAPPQAPAAQQLDADGRLWVSLEAGDAAARSAIAETGTSIEEVLPGTVYGVATPESFARLKAQGVNVLKASPLLKVFNALDFPPADQAYHNYKELVSDLNAVAASAPEAVSLISIGRSFLGKDILGLRFNATEKGDAPSAKPGIVFFGSHHAREHLSSEVPLLLAKHLADNRAKPEIARLLASRDIYIVPMVNPDGSEYDIYNTTEDGKPANEKNGYRMHRKNMRKNKGGSLGVDLNRNYGFHWGEGGASSSPSSDIYKGPTAFSEPETQAVKAFVETRKNLRVLLSYHTFSELILYPWGHSNSPLPDGKALAAFKAMAKTMAGMTGYTPQQSSELYIASGDTCDWAWGVHGIFAFTFELSPKSMWGGGFYPGAAAIATTFAANIRPALYLIDLADNPYRAAAPLLGRVEEAGAVSAALR